MPAHDIPSGYTLLVCHIRPARRKARVAAIVEILILLERLDAAASLTGPLAEEKGVFWIGLPEQSVNTAAALFPYLGYTTAVDQLQLATDSKAAVHWHGATYQLTRL